MLPLFPAMCFLLETDPRMMELVLRLDFNIPRGTGMVAAAVGAVALPAAGLLLNRISAWIVRGVGGPSAVRQPVTA